MPDIASRITRLTLNADRVLTTGSIRVYSVYIANTTTTPVEVVFHDNDGIPLLNMVCPAFGSENFAGLWLADNGLKVLSLDDAGVIVTILHGQDGA